MFTSITIDGDGKSDQKRIHAKTGGQNFRRSAMKRPLPGMNNRIYLLNNPEGIFFIQ